MGDVPTATQEEVRTAFANVQAFFSERLDAGTADYTLYVAGDRESVAAVYRRSYGNEPSPDFCNGARAGVVAIITLSCLESDPQYLERRHFDSIRERLAPWASLPQLSDGLDRRGPQRLLLATRTRSAPTSGTRSLTHGSEAGHRTQARSCGISQSIAAAQAGSYTRDGLGLNSAALKRFLLRGPPCS